MFRLGLQSSFIRLKQLVVGDASNVTSLKLLLNENATTSKRCAVFETLLKEQRQQQQVRWLLTSCCLKKSEDRRAMLASMPREDEGVDGEKSLDIDADVASRSSLFPDETTPNLLFDGVRFAELPICYIKSSHNNTIMFLTSHKGEPILSRSCGMEGFKNAKKGTNIAAQATAITMSMRALRLGIKNIRVKIRGLGPGRMASIKGLEMGGMNIVSISDNTPVPYGKFPRPRKQRRL